MQRFEYVAWVRDHSLPVEDEDYEWCDVLRITASSAAEAQECGDALAKDSYPPGTSQEFVRSSVELTDARPHPSAPEVDASRPPAPREVL